MPYRPAFFAFPNDPIELRDPILAAVELVKANPDVSVTPWPNLPVFGAAIPDEVREGIEKAAVFVGDITRPNRNVYYEIGWYSIGLGKALAPVLNVSSLTPSRTSPKMGFSTSSGTSLTKTPPDWPSCSGTYPQIRYWICTPSR